jgi:hypothetical protein
MLRPSRMDSLSDLRGTSAVSFQQIWCKVWIEAEQEHV